MISVEQGLTEQWRVDWEKIERAVEFTQMRFFLSTLFKGYEPRGYIEFRFIKADLFPHTQWFKLEWLQDPDDRLHHFKALYVTCTRAVEDGREIYVGVLPRDIQDGSRRSVTRARWLWGDFDSKVAAEDEALHSLCINPEMPSMIVYTGGGFHAYWPLQQDGEDMEYDLARGKPVNSIVFEAMNNQWSQGVLPGVDKVGDTPHVMRLPGFKSTKREEIVRLISVHGSSVK